MNNIVITILHYVTNRNVIKRIQQIIKSNDRYILEYFVKLLLSIILVIILLFMSWNMGIGQTNISRIILGLIFLGLFPGDALLSILFPRRNSIILLERFVFMIIISISVITLIGFILNYTTWGIRVESLLWVTEIIIVIFYSISFFQRRNIYKNEEELITKVEISNENNITVNNRHINMFSLIISIIGIIALILLLGLSGPQEKYTEFFILDSNNHLGIENNNYLLNETLPLNFVVINHEGKTENYHLLLIASNGSISRIASFQVMDQKQWNQIYILNLYKLGEKQIYKFILYREGDLEPYRSLQIVISVYKNSN